MANEGAVRGQRSPLIIDVSRLGRRPGSMRTLQETVPAPRRIGLDLVGIAQAAPVDLDLQLESVSEGVLVTGTASAPTIGECARCLRALTGELTVDLTELFAYPGSETEATTDDDEVGHVFTDNGADSIDLEQTIVDAVGLVLPFSPLCTQDCPGLCPDCGVALATAESDHHHDAIDPRWAKLSQLHLDRNIDDSGDRT